MRVCSQVSDGAKTKKYHCCCVWGFSFFFLTCMGRCCACRLGRGITLVFLLARTQARFVPINKNK
jgi:hypothetical protein